MERPLFFRQCLISANRQLKFNYMQDYVPCSGSCTYELPVHNVSDCELPNDEKITELRFGYNGKPLTTATPIPGTNFATQTTARAEEWAERLDNESTRTEKDNAIRFLTVPDFFLPDRKSTR